MILNNNRRLPLLLLLLLLSLQPSQLAAHSLQLHQQHQVSPRLCLNKLSKINTSKSKLKRRQLKEDKQQKETVNII